ncbi:MAG: DNA polymerase III subunit epsilon [Thermaurantiacus tibetensis]|uniref:DNA polymerase III subunit epsilon n=1 Tax=Thermaurantiacus tibetensis TaxID=2759035 RepID=UPI0018903A1A|nr:DNA polymerase III subunit epsilon [Thermaurantiacus tibetensis]
MREIVLDTETTGLDPREGHRLVELAAVELRGRMPTGATLHLHFNPGRPMPPEAERVHGLSDAFLADKPPFAACADEILAFLGDSPIVAHNARFDWQFLNAELVAAGRPPIPEERLVDTLDLARARLPGAKHSLDALCQRFGIDLSRRVKHGAMIDTELLARVYVELTGGRQMGFDLEPGLLEAAVAPPPGPARTWPVRHFEVPEAERLRHRAFVAQMANPLWAALEAAPAAVDGREGVS